MASFLSISPSSLATTLPAATPRIRGMMLQHNSLSTIRGPLVGGITFVPNIELMIKTAKRSSHLPPSCVKTTIITCSIAQPETLQTVQSTIAKQLSIDEASVTPETKFADLGADSLDTVEIMMALEEKFDVSIGEGGAENIVTVQDAADLIQKVKTAAAT